MGHGTWGARRRSPPPSPPLSQSHTPVVGSLGHAGQKVMRTLAQSLPQNLPDHGGAGPREPAAPPLSPPPPPRRPAPARRRGGEGWWVAGTPARARSAVAGRARGYATALGARITTLDGRQVARRRAGARGRVARRRAVPFAPPLTAAAPPRVPRPPRRSRITAARVHAPWSMQHATCTCTSIDAGKPKN